MSKKKIQIQRCPNCSKCIDDPTIARFFGSLCPTNRMEFVVENIEAPN